MHGVLFQVPLGQYKLQCMSAILEETYTNELKNTNDRQLDTTLGSNMTRSQMEMTSERSKCHDFLMLILI